MITRRLAIAAGCGLLIAGAGVWLSLGSARDKAPRTIHLFDPSSVWFLSSTIGWVEDDYGQRLLMTTNGGQSWINVSPPALGRPRRVTRRSLAGVLFESRLNFWAAVAEERPTGRFPVELLHTTDAGRSWTAVRSFPGDYGYVWIDFLNQRRGWLMIDNGAASGDNPVTIYRTDSGGARWTELGRSAEPMRAGTPGAPSPFCDKTGISFASTTSGWIAEYCSTLADLQFTRDGGAHWQSLPLTRPDPKQIEYGGGTLPPRFFTPDVGVFVAEFDNKVGGGDVIYTTKNAGVTWTPHAVPTGPSGERLDIVSPTTWIAAAGHTLYATTNAGASWVSQHSTLSFAGLIPATFDFANPADGWAITNIGQIQRLWRTTTGGRHWTMIR